MNVSFWDDLLSGGELLNFQGVSYNYTPEDKHEHVLME